MRKVEHEKRIAKREEKEKGKSGTWTELKPHFILRFRVFFLKKGLMTAPTTIFSFVTAYIGAHNFFF